MGCSSSLSNATDRDFHDCYHLGEKLGRGVFGQVRVATPVTQTGAETNEVAVKIIGPRSEDDSARALLLKDASREAALWNRAKASEHVVKLYDVYYSAELCYFVMEKCARNLLQHMEGLNEVDERSIGNIIMEMLLGVAHLHAVGIIHRDVKPSNFVVGGSSGKTIKLTDFGLSVRMVQEGVTSCAGTVPFMCPEMLQGKPCDYKADVWSIGVIAYVFLFGEFPYTNKRTMNSQGMVQAIVRGSPPRFAPKFSKLILSESGENFLHRTLARDQSIRPLAKGALVLPYMRAIREHRHMTHAAKLPSLRANLHVARRIGAFDRNEIMKKDKLDDLLNRVHVERYGKPLAGCDLESRLSAAVADIHVPSLKFGSGHSSRATTTTSRGSTCTPTNLASDLSSANAEISIWGPNQSL